MITAVLIILLLAAAVSSAVIFSRRNEVTERLSSQLSSTADIYISLHEINFIDDTFIEVRNNKTEAADIIGDTRTNCQQMIRAIMERFSDDTTRESLLDFVDFSKLNVRLKDRNTITTEFLSADKLWRRARYIVSERTPDGRVARAMYLIEDINEEKRARDLSLEAVKTLNEQMASVANIYFTMHDIDLANDSFTEIKTNIKDVSDLIGDDRINAQETMYAVMKQMSDPATRAALLEFVDFSTLNERLRNRNTITQEFLSFKGVWSRARFVVSKRNEDGTVNHVMWLVEGIDEEKRQRDELAETAEMLNYRISSIADIYQTAHDIDLENDTFTEIKSDSRMISELIGDNRENARDTLRHVMESVADEAFAESVLRFTDLETIESRMFGNKTITIEYMNKNKQWRRGRFIASRRDESGRLKHILWLTEDIDSEKKERAELIDLSERAFAESEAKSSFLSNMSHEIRTPISAVLGLNEMILRECDDASILEYSENIRNAGNTLLALINDILDFSKIEAGKMSINEAKYDLTVLINDLANMIRIKAEEKGLHFVLDISPEIPKNLFGDAIRIRQIITNLLTNAVKYTEKGSIELSIRYREDAGDPENIVLVVSVRDSGIGIKPEDMRKLFSEFERIDEDHNTSVEGTGLGISITEKLLGLMGSTLRVDSIYGLGSRFWFELKQKTTDREAVGNLDASSGKLSENRSKYYELFRAPDACVLVADDTVINIMVFRSLLKRTEIKIDSAESGAECLKLSAAKKYDIIFLDHMMPDMDGIETLKRLRRDHDNPNAQTPVVCLTANAVSGAREKYIEAGFDEYLTKPIDPELLEILLADRLPEEKVIVTDPSSVDESAGEREASLIPGSIRKLEEIDTAAGVENCGDENSYLETLGIYAEMVDEYADSIDEFLKNGDTENAVIRIHALKSTSRIIGASALGSFAEELEKAGRNGDTEKLMSRAGELTERSRKLGQKLKGVLK
ncbi:MAG: response regulator [Oscillospiraceae bacterium]|nr:response regulator [Oscillospiraceae bacterium]